MNIDGAGVLVNGYHFLWTDQESATLWLRSIDIREEWDIKRFQTRLHRNAIIDSSMHYVVTFITLIQGGGGHFNMLMEIYLHNCMIRNCLAKGDRYAYIYIYIYVYAYMHMKNKLYLCLLPHALETYGAACPIYMTQCSIKGYINGVRKLRSVQYELFPLICSQMWLLFAFVKLHLISQIYLAPVAWHNISGVGHK